MYYLPSILIFPYLFLILRIFRNLLKIKPFDVSSGPVTSVSVVVACHNEERNIQSLLKSISLQDYPADLLEVIIVDDNSTDKTFESASAFSGNQEKIVLHNTGTGKKQAIRTGINASSGNLIITTDADCRMGGKWLKTIAAYYEEQKPDMIICPVQIEAHSGFFGRFQELEFLSLQGITAGTAFSGDDVMCNGANLSFTREAYLSNSHNLHDEISSGDDIFLLYSLKKDRQSKIKWLEANDALVTSTASQTIRSFLKQRRRWISKGTVYNDRFTILLGIVTFFTILLELTILVAGILDQAYIPVFLAIFLLKSIPDYLILKNTSQRYGRKKLMNWFLPVEIIYPFYVIIVFAFSLISSGKPKC